MFSIQGKDGNQCPTQPRTCSRLTFEGHRDSENTTEGEPRGPGQEPQQQPCTEPAKRTRCFVVLADAAVTQESQVLGARATKRGHFHGNNKPTYESARCGPGSHPLAVRKPHFCLPPAPRPAIQGRSSPLQGALCFSPDARAGPRGRVLRK